MKLITTIPGQGQLAKHSAFRRYWTDDDSIMIGQAVNHASNNNADGLEEVVISITDVKSEDQARIKKEFSPLTSIEDEFPFSQDDEALLASQQELENEMLNEDEKNQ